MKSYLIALLFVFTAGCSHVVNIERVKLSHITESSVFLEIETNEDLEKFVDSYWAYKPFLVYRMDSKKDLIHYSKVKPADLLEIFPFSAQRETSLGLEDKYKTIWKIPKKKSINVISKREDFYNIRNIEDPVVTLMIYGATMGGGHLISSPKSFVLIDSKE